MLSPCLAMNYLLVDIPLAFGGLLVGFFSAMWYVRYKSDLSGGEEQTAEDTSQKEKTENDTERANMAALQLRDLAKNVLTDVGAHNTLVSAISDELEAITAGPNNSPGAVTNAVAKIVTANDKLQNRLADAEQKIQTQAEEIRAQQSEARTDSLTKIANRRAFDDVLEKNVASFNIDRKPFSLLIFDVDHFKNSNDTHGHQAGDEVLRQVARTLTETVKSSDVPCRYGGEEFALVMPNTKIDSARITSERVRKAIEAMAIQFEGKTLRVTASIGVAEIGSGDDSVRTIRRSDDCVYAAKEAGRNQSYWSDGQECLPINSLPSAKGVPTQASPPEKPSTAQKSSSSSSSSSTLDELPTRTVFSGELTRRIAESHRFGVSLSIMHLQVGDYANLVKEYGDAVGQLLLDSVAQFIRSTLRDMDLLGKLRDGDFVVMLPGSSEKEANMVGGRVQDAISQCVIPIGDKKLQLELQLGVTDVYPTDNSESMMARAFQLVEPAKAIPVA